MKKFICYSFVFLAAMLLSGNLVPSQTDKSRVFDKDFALLQKDLRAEKKRLIAANLSLTESEAAKFWGVYDQYAAELEKIYDARLALVNEYANYEKLTEVQSVTLNQRVVANEEAITKLRQEYVPKIERILPGRKAALFFQIEKRLGLLIDLQIASEIPLVIREAGTEKKEFRTLKVLSP